MVDMVDVTSSTIQKVGYSDELKELYIQFKNGVKYKYVMVPKSCYENLMKAESKGWYINRFIKGLFNFIKF